MKKLTSTVASIIIAAGMYSPMLAQAENLISLDDAIDTARNKINGDLIEISVDYDEEDNREFKDKYELTFINDDKVYEVEVDAQFGSIDDIDEDDLDDDDRTEYEAFKKSKVSLSRAIEAATQRINGEVIDAEFNVENGKGVYDIEILKDNRKHKLKVTAK